MILLEDSEIYETLEIYGNLHVHGDLKVKGNIICDVEYDVTAFCDEDMLIKTNGLTISNNKIYVNGKLENNPAKIGLALIHHIDELYQDIIQDYYSEDIIDEE